MASSTAPPADWPKGAGWKEAWQEFSESIDAELAIWIEGVEKAVASEGESAGADDPATHADVLADVLGGLFGEDALDALTSTDEESEEEISGNPKIEALADVLGGLLGDDALDLFDDHEGKAWEEGKHPRGHGGIFIKKGSAEAVSATGEAIKKIKAGDKSPEARESLAEHLNLLTVPQLNQLKKEHGLKAPAKLRGELIVKLGQHLGGESTGEPAPAEKPAKKPASEKPVKKPAAPKKVKVDPAAVKAHIEAVLGGDKSPERRQQLTQALGSMTVAQLNQVKKEHGLKVTGKLKAQLVEAITEKLHGGTAAPPKPAEKPIEKPAPAEKPAKITQLASESKPAAAAVEVSPQLAKAAREAGGKIKEIASRGISSHEHAVALGEHVDSFIDAQTAGEKKSHADAIARKDQLYKQKKYREAEAAYKDIEAAANKLASARKTAYKELMGNVREMGLGKRAPKFTDGSTDEGKKLYQESAGLFPSSWRGVTSEVKVSHQFEGKSDRISGAAYYPGEDERGPDIRAGSGLSMAHEMMHHMEYNDSTLGRLQQQFFDAKTKGQGESHIGMNTYRKGFVLSYMGTENQRGRSYEILSKCMDEYFGGVALDEDHDTRRFFLGVMAGV